MRAIKKLSVWIICAFTFPCHSQTAEPMAAAESLSKIELLYWSDLGEVPLSEDGRPVFREVYNRLCTKERLSLKPLALSGGTEEWALSARGGETEFTENDSINCIDFKLTLTPDSIGQKQTHLVVDYCPDTEPGSDCRAELPVTVTVIDSTTLAERRQNEGVIHSGTFQPGNRALKQVLFHDNERLLLWDGREALVVNPEKTHLSFPLWSIQSLPARFLCRAGPGLTAACQGEYMALWPDERLKHFLPLAPPSKPFCYEDAEGTLRVSSVNDCLPLMNETVRGLVEVCPEKIHGAVCNDFFGQQEVQVSCRQLGLKEGLALNPNDGNVPDSERSPCLKTGVPFVLDDLKCTGAELRLQDCTSSLKEANCFAEYEQAALSCGEPVIESCEEGDGDCQQLLSGCPAPSAYPQTPVTLCVRALPAGKLVEGADLSQRPDWNSTAVTQWAGIDGEHWVVARNETLELLALRNNTLEVIDEVTGLGSGALLAASPQNSFAWHLHRNNSLYFLERKGVSDEGFEETGAQHRLSILSNPESFDISGQGVIAVLDKKPDESRQVVVFSKISQDSNAAIPGVQVVSDAGVTNMRATTNSEARPMYSLLSVLFMGAFAGLGF